MMKNIKNLFAAICFVCAISYSQTNGGFKGGVPVPPSMLGTNAPTPPTFPVSMVPPRTAAKIVATARKSIDKETRPKVSFQTSTDLKQWETLGTWEPWRLYSFYRITINGTTNDYKLVKITVPITPEK